MHINNPETLKSWLTVILEPLCDADPSALSRYVIALLKKDKPPKELSGCMADQLDVFLGIETLPFLDKLFAAIESEEYLKELPIPTPSDKEVENIIVVSGDPMMNKGIHENTPPIETKHLLRKDALSEEPSSKTSTISVQNSEIESPINSKIASPPFVPQSPPIKDKNEKENITNFTRRHKISMRSRTRSRSRSYEKSRRSRSRERRLNEREKNNRQFRNRSPLVNKDRKRQERSPRSYGKSRHSQSRSRSGSPADRRKISRSMSPGKLAEVSAPAKRMRCRDFDEKGYCMRGETCPWDHGVDPVVLEDINNPTLISSIQTNTVTNNQRSAASMHNEYSPDAPDLWSRGGNFMGPRGNLSHRTGGGGGGIGGGYPRGGPNSNFRGGPQFPFPGNPNAPTPLQRELIPVPVVEGGANNSSHMDISSQHQKRRFDSEDNAMNVDGGVRRKLPINTRLGPRIQQNCSLELRKVPRGLNSIAHLNNHFSKFGKIFNIQISYDGDPEAAIITFSSHAEANVAYRSTEAVLNNRFIKVFWHSPTATNNSVNNVGSEASIANATSLKEESQSRRIFTSQHTLSNVPAIPVGTTAETASDIANKAAAAAIASTSASTSTTSSIAASVQSSLSSLMNPTNIPQTAGQIRLKTNRITRATKELIRKKKEEQVKNAIQIANGLYKRKTDLLQGYLKQLKTALELVEKVDPSDHLARAKYITTIKELQVGIDKLRKEIAVEKGQIAVQISNSNPNPVKKSKEQQQKELLDIELELITQQQEGNDTTVLQKKLLELQRSYGTTSAITRPPFVRAQRVKPAPPGSTSVDRRPTTLTIVGFSTEESDAVLGHFKHYGEITKNQLDKTVPSLTISYATRLNAEQAMLRGKTYKDKRLQITWAIQSTVIDSTTEKVCSQPSDNNGTAASNDLSEMALEDEEEEEDTESEDRSWRR